ncbi:MAG: hypothetical protein K5924_00370 [Chloroflexi bacterium]|nr:hypothetical protein [Chloroflexota bacterium]
MGRTVPDGPWVGFAPTLDDGYALVIGAVGHDALRVAAEPRELLALAALYFEDALDPPPDDLAATLGDIGSLVRHVAEHEADDARRALLAEAVDAVDDGLAADVTIARLNRTLGERVDAAALIRGRVEELLGGG